MSTGPRCRWASVLALALGLASCRAEPEPLEVDVEVVFDTEVANVGRVVVDGTHTIRWGEEADQLDRTAWPGENPSLVGLPQGRTVHVAAEGGRPLAVDVPVVGLPDLELLWSSPEAEMATGFVVVAILDDVKSGIAIYDGLGRLVWGWRAPDEDVSAHPVFSRSGTDLLAFFAHRDRGIDAGRIRRIPLVGEAVSESRAVRGHHAFVEREDGRLTWLSREFPELDMTELGIDKSWTVMNDTIRNGDEGTDGEGELLFDLLEEEPLFHPCSHFDTLHARYGYTAVHDWSHANSLVLDEATGELIFGVRLHDSIYGIDADTGERRWKVTGDWSHGHFTDAISDRVLLFDNGTHREPPASRVVELAIDRAAQTAEVVWELDQPDGGFTAWLGDARYLPGGNRLLAFTEAGRILEVSPEGEILWEARAQASFVGRIRFAEHLEPPP